MIEFEKDFSSLFRFLHFRIHR